MKVAASLGFLVLLSLVVTIGTSVHPHKDGATASFGRMAIPLTFEQNLGQLDPAIRFQARYTT